MVSEQILKQFSDLLDQNKDQDNISLPEELSKKLESDDELKKIWNDFQKLNKALKKIKVENPPKEYLISLKDKIDQKIVKGLDKNKSFDPVTPPFPDTDSSTKENKSSSGRLSLIEVVGGASIPSISSGEKKFSTTEDSGLIRLKDLIPVKLDVKEVDDSNEIQQSQLAPIKQPMQEKSVSLSARLAYVAVGILSVVVVILLVMVSEKGRIQSPQSEQTAIQERKLIEYTGEQPSIQEHKEVAVAPVNQNQDKNQNVEGSIIKEEQENISEAMDQKIIHSGRRELSKKSVNRIEKNLEKDSQANIKVVASDKLRETEEAKVSENKVAAQTNEQAGDANKKAGKANSLDELLLGATGLSGGAGDNPAVEIPDTPSKNLIREVMRGISNQIKQQCSTMVEQPIIINSQITFSNSGSVTIVVASGGPDPANKCVEKIAKTARFPRFKQNVFVVNYPFNIRPPQ